MKNTWIVVAENPAIGALVDLAKALPAAVHACVVGTEAIATQVAASGVDKVVWVPLAPDVPAEAYARAVSSLLVEADPGVVLAANRPADKVLLGAAAAALGAPALNGVTSIAASPDGITVVRDLFGGIATQTLAATDTVALTLDGGKCVDSGAACPVERVEAVGSSITVVESRPTTVAKVDLGAAKRVVSAGRGLKAEADLALVRGLAEVIHAEVGCSRPLAEGQEWLPKAAYVGISGQNIAPDLYLAVGISGQLQHTAGIRKAKTIVVINSDKNAPFFANCDYGIVGDLYAVVPALTDALK